MADHHHGIDQSPNGDGRRPRTEPANGTPVLPGHRALLELPFAAEDLPRLRHLVARRAEDAGLADFRLGDFVLAVHEIASNAVVHGGGTGRILLDRADGGLRCTVTDHGPGLARPLPPAGPSDGDQENGRGLWLAQALSDRLDVMACAAGTTVTLMALLD